MGGLKKAEEEGLSEWNGEIIQDPDRLMVGQRAFNPPVRVRFPLRIFFILLA